MNRTKSCGARAKSIWANLAVKNVERTRRFYTELGFKPNPQTQNNTELASFLIGENDFAVHFFSCESEQFKTSFGSKIADLKQGNEVMFTLSASSREEVDSWALAVRDAGGTVFSQPAQIIRAPWYGCGFADPDGHKWNVFYMPKTGGDEKKTV